MTRRHAIALSSVLLAILIVSLLLFREKSLNKASTAKQSPARPEPIPPAARSAANQYQEQSRDTYPQLPATSPSKYDPNLAQWKEWQRRSRDDKKWEWKVPITFYGRVVDLEN